MAMVDKALGRPEPVDVREVWSSEFTPWLVRADLLCKDVGLGACVLIESQLEPTDHVHRGMRG